MEEKNNYDDALYALRNQ